MTSSLLRAAIRNNAFWCDAVCRAQGFPGEFSSTLWFHRSGTPPFYPDIITLTGAETADEQQEAIAALVHSENRSWTVKDSHAALDLAPLGFSILFDAEWIGLRTPPTLPGQLTWRRMQDEAELANWEAEWSKGNPSGMRRIFAGSLLQDPDIAFMLALRGQQPVGGGILSSDAGATGLSNIFASEGLEAEIREGLVAQPVTLFPHQPLVGYEQGDDLDAALALGFELLGPLRIWIKET